MFVAFAQSKGTVQAVAFIIIEAGALIAASVLRPWMDKSTNSFNIAICVFNFLNAVFLLIFTDVFNQPPLVTAVVGVVLWIANGIFSLILLLMLIVTTLIVFFRENPDARYQYMADDRVSFMKSQTQLNTTTELDALAATARGDKAGYSKGLDLDDDAQSITSDSLRRSYPAHLPLPGSTTTSLSQNSTLYGNPPRSPVDPSTPLFPSDAQRASDGQRGPPSYRPNPSQASMARSQSPSPYGPNVGRSSPSPYSGNNMGRASPSPFAGSSTNLSSGTGARQNTNSPR
jgi:hypothetical protein